jgi:site-specific DNA-methyltransferase (adenine-specific)
MTIRVEHGDCREIIPTLGVTVDAVVTDPPYHLSDMTKRFGRAFNANGQRNTDGTNHYQRLAGGFMGQQWDGGDIAFRPETWATIGSVLRPGGFLVAFGGTRTSHRLACAIEDAGFIIQDCLMWLFATGFPKRRDMLKPAYEPIVLAYKPGGKRTMQVDECRIATNGEDMGDPEGYARRSALKADGWLRPHHGKEADKARSKAAIEKAQILGRWPANICHDGSDEVVALFPETGVSSGGKGAASQAAALNGHVYGKCSGNKLGQNAGGLGDSGSAARFFFSAKASAQDRWGSKHPTVKPVELMKWLVALVTPPGGTVLDPFAGSGTTGVAALATSRNAILIEREDAYIADIRERVAFYEGSGQHSTQAKHRNRKVDHGPLFEPRPLTPDEDAADSLASYNTAVMAIGERVKAGMPVPEFMLSRKVAP